MAVAWLVTLLAIAGVCIGVMLGASRIFSSQIAAAGGGLLLGVALFWVLPEIAESSNWPVAVALAVASCAVIAVLDSFLTHAGHSPRSGAIVPILAATVIHCFLDGWTVRLLGEYPLTNVAVGLGIALHKIPEGFALGWVLRRSFQSAAGPLVLGTGAELMTAVAAWIEPRANTSATAALGVGWTIGVLSIICGGLLYIGFHVVVPARRNPGVVPLFAACFSLMAAVAWFKG